jgi:hypothetical protein
MNEFVNVLCFSVYFPYIEKLKETYDITSLSVCLSVLPFVSIRQCVSLNFAVSVSVTPTPFSLCVTTVVAR